MVNNLLLCTNKQIYKTVFGETLLQCMVPGTTQNQIKDDNEQVYP
jgi:hypothetical protein